MVKTMRPGKKEKSIGKCVGNSKLLITPIKTYEEVIKENEKYIEVVKSLTKRIKELELKRGFGIVWERQSEDVVENIKYNYPYFYDVDDKCITTDLNNLTHLLIEADNYNALYTLYYTHKGKIDVIYIDPPYNFGSLKTYSNKDVNPNDEYERSKWLSLMERRLILARELLTENGIIFISIDNYMYPHLQLLCNNIFKENNFVSQLFVWKRTGQQQNKGKNIAIVTDYILCYCKSFSSGTGKKDIIKKDNIKNRKGIKAYSYDDGDGKGLYRTNPIQHGSYGEYSWSYPNPITGEIISGSTWLKTLEEFTKEDKAGNVHWASTKGGLPTIKKYLDTSKETVRITNLIDESKITNEEGDEYLKNILPNMYFTNPKPVGLIKYLIGLCKNKNAIVLDFFAGSGTTGDAVLQLNNDDGGGRKFILCNIEEEDQDNPGIFICSDICYSRIKSIIKGYTGATNGEIIEGLGGNLKYMRVGFVSREDIIENRIKFVDNIKDLICVKTDCFVEHTSNEFFKIFTNVNETNYVCIMYEREDIDLLKKEVKKIISKNKKDLDNIVIYIFSYSNFIPTKIFKDFGDLVKLCAIPEIMYEVYNEIQII